MRILAPFGRRAEVRLNSAANRDPVALMLLAAGTNYHEGKAGVATVDLSTEAAVAGVPRLMLDTGGHRTSGDRAARVRLRNGRS
jgi:hypothetical protein